MPLKKSEEDFRLIIDDLEISGTSYRVQLGLVNGKWASRLLKGRNVIDLYVYKDEEVLVSVVEEAMKKIESIMKKESVDEVSFERQYLPEIIEEEMLELSKDDGLPILKGFVEMYFRASGLITKIHGKVIKFFKGNEPFPGDELFKKIRDTIKTHRAENNKKDLHELKELNEIGPQNPKTNAPNAKSYKATYKVLIFGDQGVGKETFLARFAKRKFDEKAQSTIGANFYVKEQEIADKKIKFHIWLFGGEERFRFLLPIYTRGINGAFFMYDVTNYSSLAHIDDWLIVVRNRIKSEIPILLVGNKADHEDAREVSSEEGINIARSRGLDGFIECSAKTGENVEEIFEALTSIIIKKREITNNPKT